MKDFTLRFAPNQFNDQIQWRVKRVACLNIATGMWKNVTIQWLIEWIARLNAIVLWNIFVPCLLQLNMQLIEEGFSKGRDKFWKN
jgi:hypothetical protein